MRREEKGAKHTNMSASLRPVSAGKLGQDAGSEDLLGEAIHVSGQDALSYYACAILRHHVTAREAGRTSYSVELGSSVAPVWSGKTNDS